MAAAEASRKASGPHEAKRLLLCDCRVICVRMAFSEKSEEISQPLTNSRNFDEKCLDAAGGRESQNAYMISGRIGINSNVRREPLNN